MRSMTSSHCHCPVSNSVRGGGGGVASVVYGDVADSVVLPTDESCYDEVVEATGDDDVCEFNEFAMTEKSSCQKRGMCSVRLMLKIRNSSCCSAVLEFLSNSLCCFSVGGLCRHDSTV